VPFLTNAAGYLFSLLTIRGIRARLRPERETGGREAWWHSLTAGLRFVRGDRFIRTTLGFVTVSDFLMNAMMLLVVLRATQLGLHARTIGILLGCGGAGGILGALIAAKLHDRLPPLTVFMPVVPALTALLVTAIALVDIPAIVGLCYGLTFAAWPAWNGLVTARRLAAIPDQQRGRVFSVTNLIGSGPSAFAPAAAGLLAAHQGPVAVCLAAAGGMAVLALAAIAPPVRHAVQSAQI
jgi:predicted MFS family arabinose efflux permease